MEGGGSSDGSNALYLPAIPTNLSIKECNATDVTIPAAAINADWTHNIDGYLATGTGLAGFVATKNTVITGVYLYGFTLGTSSSTIIDIHKNGTTVFTTQVNRPSLAFNDADHVSLSSAPDVASLVAGDYLTIDIDQVANNSMGLTIVIAMYSADTAITFNLSQIDQSGGTGDMATPSP